MTDSASSSLRPHVLIIDDHELFATSLARSLSRPPTHAQVSIATTAQSGLALSEKDRFDLVLCDLALPDLYGIEVVRALTERTPPTRVCVLSANTTAQPMRDALELGACGYLSKNIDIDDFVDKVTRAALGENVYDERSAMTLISEITNADAPPTLTARERAVLEMLAMGWSHAEMGAELSIATSTVADHVRSLYAKLHVRTPHAAVAAGFRKGLLH